MSTLLRTVILFSLLATPLKFSLGQDRAPRGAESIREKIKKLEGIESASSSLPTQQILKRTLLHQYGELAKALRAEIETLNKIRAAAGDAGLEGEIKANADGLGQELAKASEKIQELQGDVVRLASSGPQAAPDAVTAGPAAAGDSVASPARANEIALTPAGFRPAAESSSLPSPSPSQNETRGGKITEEDYLPKGCEEVPQVYPKNGDRPRPNGIIWCGRQEQLPAQTLAERGAPILWFSPNEFLLNTDGKIRIPQKLFETNPSGAMVYYRISKLVVKSDEHERGARDLYDEGKLNLSWLKGLTLRYYFYYPMDKGGGQHAHDLEYARYDIRVAEEKVGSDKLYVVSIHQVLGGAHGVTWYDNILNVENDTSLPVTILVEENKHASCPDRNADGHYSPGYDVNERINDAWGVRDIFGSGQLGGSSYEGSMTKPRVADRRYMVMVNPTSGDCDRTCLLKPYRGDPENKNKIIQTYTLERVDAEKLSAEQAAAARRQSEIVQESTEHVEEDYTNLLRLMEREHFLQEKLMVNTGSSLPESVMKFGLAIERGEEAVDALTLSLRYDQGYGFSLSPPIGRLPVPLLGGYGLLKFNYIRADTGPRFSFDGLYTPSASRTVDWYAAVGAEFLRPFRTEDYEARLVTEGGVKFRWKQGRIPIIDKKLPFLGVRLGARTNGFTRQRNTRFVFEFGTGAF